MRNFKVSERYDTFFILSNLKRLKCLRRVEDIVILKFAN